MSYTPFLVANFATGLDKELQPWLLPNDAFTELFDGFVYRGIAQIRNGYSGYATGLGGTPCESRMVHNVAAANMSPAPDEANQVFTASLTPPVRRGTTVIAGSNPVQSFTDNGLGYFLLSSINISGATNASPCEITTAVNHGYTTGDQVVISSIEGMTELNSPVAYTITVTGLATFTLDGIDSTNFEVYVSGGTSQKVAGTINYDTGAVSITLPAIPVLASTVTITYDYHPGNPVMGIMTFYPDTNIAQMIVADTQYVNKYVPATDRLEDISKPPPATPYGGNAKDFWGWVNYAAADSTPRLLFCNGVVGDVIQMWDGTSVTDYPAKMDSAVPPVTGFVVNARQIFEVQDRLVLFQTIESGVLYPRRIRISGFGANTDNFDISAAGAGFIDIPDNSWFYGATQNRNDIIIFTETSVWIMKYSGNDVVPFQLFRIDGSRGSKAAFGVYTYLNRSIAISPRGMIEVDGYKVDRMDDNLPYFTINEVKGDSYEYIFCGFLDEERDVYMLYPSTDWTDASLVPENSSDRILVINFEEDNFCQYRLPLSCMGNFKETDVILWEDLTEANGFPNWGALGAIYGSWNAFPFNVGAPIGIGGGHKGEIFELNTDEAEDNILHIRDITYAAGESGSILTVTTDWNNYKVGDMIFFNAVEGISGLNYTQVRIESINTSYKTFVTQETSVPVSGTYTANTGYTSRVIPFEAKTKTLNPFINSDKKLKIGWIYVYVETTETWLEANEDGVKLPAILKMDVYINDDPNPTQPTFSYDIDCTQPSNQPGIKKWVKIWINQVGKFIQLKFSNEQAGANMKVHAFMPGVAGIGRLV